MSKPTFNPSTPLSILRKENTTLRAALWQLHKAARPVLRAHHGPESSYLARIMDKIDSKIFRGRR